MRSLLAALALGIATLAPGAASASALPPAAQRESALDRLVGLLLPDSQMTRLGTRAFDHALEKGTLGDAAIRADLARYPGLKAHVAEKLRPELTKLLRRALPSLRRDVRAILAAELDAEEIAAAATFFGSPTGQKVYSAALRVVGDEPDRDADKARAAATKAVMSSLAAEDFPAMMAFGASGVSDKMNVVNPKIAAAGRVWAERLVTESSPRMNKLAAKATRKFVATRRKS